MPRAAEPSRTLATWDAGLGIDAVEPVPPLLSFAPADRNRLAVVATYQLTNAGDRRRRGFVHLLELSRDLSTCGNVEWKLTEIAKTSDLSGVLDLRCVAMSCEDGWEGVAGGCDGAGFCSPVGAVVLTACANGTVCAFLICSESGLDCAASRYRFQPAWTWSAAETLGLDGTACIVLSIDVSSATESEENAPATALAVLTTSVGSLHVVEFTATSCVCLHNIPLAHTDSAWSATLLPSASAESLESAPCNYVLYSGGDDGTLACWDLRVGATQPTQRLRKTHNGVGVTSIVVKNVASPGDDSGCFEILTGGYDDALRLWDVRSMRSSVADVDCGGGVWRIKGYPGGDCEDGVSSQNYLLGCMYNGFKIASVDQHNSMSIVSTYDEHESLAYGAAWLRSERDGSILMPGYEEEAPADRGNEPQSLLVSRGVVALTGSFYDNALHAWLV